ncbi:transcriptional regulator [Rodentibacter trehalosifermentans]|uniref:Transcriptional regulator n=1 Tax=Rodentibacter trehalosifermentans TaxID=1908263 RepID=A0A1V3J4I7_9PAST|nr:transcriptional regulator [Rodentibacter trehalosifermentans]OOF49749.1 transcriptional regulator [Rodentibacter trehalosifermentans]
MESRNAKFEFSLRLKQSLEDAGFAGLSLSSIATKFNLRHPNKPITPQTVHNWLIGVSIPTDDKIDTLAKLLHTSPEWLRYGIIHFTENTLSPEEQQVLTYFRKITPAKKQAVLGILKALQV